MDIIPETSIGLVNSITEYFIELGGTHKYISFFLGTFLESLGIPFASMPAFATAGYYLNKGDYNLLWAIIIGGVGNTLGSTVSYLIGYFFGNTIRRIRKDHKLGKREDELQDYIKKHGTKAIFFGQLFGFTRTFISLPAGLLRMNFRKFFFATLFGGMLFVIYFAIGSIYVITFYDKFVYPYLGLSFFSLAFIIGLGYIITHFSYKFGKKAHSHYLKRKNGQNNRP